MNFSPGIKADHPAFGFAMWDNTPVLGSSQGSHYPSGPSAAVEAGKIRNQLQ